MPGYRYIPPFIYQRTDTGVFAFGNLPSRLPLMFTVEWAADGIDETVPFTLGEFRESVPRVLGADLPLQPPARRLTRTTDVNTRLADRFSDDRAMHRCRTTRLVHRLSPAKGENRRPRSHRREDCRRADPNWGQHVALVRFGAVDQRSVEICIAITLARRVEAIEAWARLRAAGSRTRCSQSGSSVRLSTGRTLPCVQRPYSCRNSVSTDLQHRFATVVFAI